MNLSYDPTISGDGLTRAEAMTEMDYVPPIVPKCSKCPTRRYDLMRISGLQLCPACFKIEIDKPKTTK